MNTIHFENPAQKLTREPWSRLPPDAGKGGATETAANMRGTGSRTRLLRGAPSAPGRSGATATGFFSQRDSPARTDNRPNGSEALKEIFDALD